MWLAFLILLALTPVVWVIVKIVKVMIYLDSRVVVEFRNVVEAQCRTEVRQHVQLLRDIVDCVMYDELWRNSRDDEDFEDDDVDFDEDDWDIEENAIHDEPEEPTSAVPAPVNPPPCSPPSAVALIEPPFYHKPSLN